MATELDDQGRLYVPKKVRERYGEKFRMVELQDGIKLIPVAEDPIQDLQDAMPGIQGVPLSRLRDQAEQAAREDALR